MKTVRRLVVGILAFACSTILTTAQSTTAQEPAKLVDFQQHIQPILEAQCLACHGSKEQKGGLRIDDLEALRGYIEAGDAEASSLWTDYLRTSDPDMLMPPASATHAGGLANADLLFIKAWINEGGEGQWRQATDLPVESQTQVPANSLGKVWAFQGLFHPAAVHLPIALLSVSSAFVLFSFFNRESCEPVAYHCLWIGALGAIAACVSGWSYAAYEGYGSGFSFDLEKSSIDRHRWLGIFVAVFAALMVPLARSVRRTQDASKKVVWLLAGVILLAAVSTTGFQGGELTYGEGHYEKYYKQLFVQTESEKKIDPGTWTEVQADQVSDEPPAAPAEPAKDASPINDAPAGNAETTTSAESSPGSDETSDKSDNP